MNWLDVVFLAVLAASTAAGIARGFARLTIGFIATVLAIVLGAWFYGVAGAIFQPYVSSRGIANFLGFVVVFFGIMLAGSLLGLLLAKLFKWVGLGWLDRLMGGVIGLLRGALISVAIVMAVLAFTGKSTPRAVIGSSLAPYFIGAADLIITVTPREMKDGFREALVHVKRAWMQPFQKQPDRLPAKEI